MLRKLAPLTAAAALAPSRSRAARRPGNRPALQARPASTPAWLCYRTTAVSTTSPATGCRWASSAAKALLRSRPCSACT